MARRIDYIALATFRYEIRRFLNFSEQAVRSEGMEPQQHQALLAIKGLEPTAKVTIGALAERLQIQHHSAVELSNRLQSRGFIRRARSASDRREVLLELTLRGEQILRRLSLAHREELRAAGPCLIAALEAAIRNGVSAAGASHTKRGRKQPPKMKGKIQGARKRDRSLS